MINQVEAGLWIKTWYGMIKNAGGNLATSYVFLTVCGSKASVLRIVVMLFKQGH